MGSRADQIDELDAQAREFQAAGRWDDEAARVNHRILELDRNHIAGSIRLGRCLEAAERWQEALDLYRWAGSRDAPGSSVARARAERLEQDMNRGDVAGPDAASSAPKAGGRAPALPTAAMDEAGADALIAKAVPPGKGREATLAFIAQTIAVAEAVDADRLFAMPLEAGKSFRLMGGRVSLLRTFKGAFYVELDTRSAPAGLVEELEGQGKLDRHAPLRDIPTSLAAHIAFEEVASWEPKLRDAHDAYVREAMTTPLGGHHGRHQPVLLNRLRGD